MNEFDEHKNNEQMKPSEEVLLKCLEMEWLDHFQTRNQTWKSLEIEAVLAIGLIGIDWQLDNIFATSMVGFLLIISTIFGFLVTIHHRNNVEVMKFAHIIDIEERLGMLEPDLFGDVKKPRPFKWIELIPLKISTSLFIIKMHLALMVFGIIYIFFRLMKS